MKYIIIPLFKLIYAVILTLFWAICIILTIIWDYKSYDPIIWVYKDDDCDPRYPYFKESDFTSNYKIIEYKSFFHAIWKIK